MTESRTGRERGIRTSSSGPMIQTKSSCHRIRPYHYASGTTAATAPLADDSYSLPRHANCPTRPPRLQPSTPSLHVLIVPNTMFFVSLPDLSEITISIEVYIALIGAVAIELLTATESYGSLAGSYGQLESLAAHWHSGCRSLTLRRHTELPFDSGDVHYSRGKKAIPRSLFKVLLIWLIADVQNTILTIVAEHFPLRKSSYAVNCKSFAV
ncbi:hypothetical protein FPV67DRAFT_1450655 [Lyophyllum atratum]|nr:hypothetical protein FPV67DRAFT_1450655 [Lyophyllum atratum]